MTVEICELVVRLETMIELVVAEPVDSGWVVVDRAKLARLTETYVKLSIKTIDTIAIAA